MLAHLDKFNEELIPGGASFANGIPLFKRENDDNVKVARPSEEYFSHKTHTTRMFLSDLVTPELVTFWKPVASFDVGIWHRWMHAQRIDFLLTPDHPVPRDFILPNSSGKNTCIQPRKSVTQLCHVLRVKNNAIERAKLSSLLQNDATFTLVNNRCFVKVLDLGAKKIFYLIRIEPSLPFMTIWLAYPSKVPGDIR